jgi:1-deoxy-D-xylulose-5-phosphate synthase
MSGFPSRAESPHDLLENSHASVGPAWAYGVAAATGQPALTVIGDGALTGGVAFEALNAIGFRRAPVVVVVNDNGRSYAVTPSRLTYGEPLTEKVSGNVHPGAFFTALGFGYRGPVDGHDISAMEEAFQAAVQGPLPCVVHVRTQKGHGWPSALTDADKRLHDIGPNHPPAPAVADSPSWSSLVGDILCEAAAVDSRVHAITAAMSDTVGLDRFRARFPTRHHDLGIAEQACVAAAAGLASQGRRPYFAVVTTFFTRALDQLINDVALHRLPVVFLLDRAGVTGPDGASHHGVYDIGLLRNVPGVEIYSPATATDVRRLVDELLRRDHGPVVIRYPKGRPVADARLARSGLVRPGSDACLIAHGSTTAIALAAADELQARDRVDCAVWRLSRIHPLDQALVRYAARPLLLVPVEEVSEESGIASSLAYELSVRQGRAVRMRPITLPAGFLPHGAREDLLDEFGFTPTKVAAHVRGALGSVPESE